MKIPVEVCLIIPMIFLIREIVSESSLACTRHGDKTCNGHTLTCENRKVIWIIDAMFGYRKGCGQQKIPDIRNCSSRCCQYLETDCFVGFSDAELRQINQRCSRQEKCTYNKFMYHVLYHSSECQNIGDYINAYSKIDYTCVSRSEYLKSSSTISTAITSWTKSTSIRSWTKSTSVGLHSLTRIQNAITLSSTAVGVSQGESTTTGPFLVAATTVKNFTDKQSNKQSSGAMIGGIVSGVILVVILVIVSVYFIKRRRMNKKQASKRNMPRTISREIRISAPIALQNTTNTMIVNDQLKSDNCKSIYENVELENTTVPTPSNNVDYELGTNMAPQLSGVYNQLEAERLKTVVYSRLDLKTFELQPPGIDIYNHLGGDNSQNSNVDVSDYNHTSAVCEHNDNYHHLSVHNFKEPHVVDCDYSHINGTNA